MKTKTKIGIKSTILFLYIWLCVGFPLGLWILVAGPSKWLSEYSHTTGMEISKENIIGKVIIILYVIIVFFLTLLIHRIIKRSTKRIIKRLLIGLLTIALLVSVYVFSFHPQWLISYSNEVQIKNVEVSKYKKPDGLEFVFGAYPNEKMIKSLKDQGYDGIISLLYKMVVPAEPILLKDEFKNAKKYGIKVINMPMMPWISGNEKTIQYAKEFIKNNKGRYYVHCYLGRDRVNIFRSAIKKNGVKTNSDLPFVNRKLEDGDKWSRGTCFKLADGVYLTPYPTDDEFIIYVLNDHFKTVISLLNGDIGENQKWVTKENKFFKEYPKDYVHYPLYAPFDEEDLDSLKKLINSKEKPILLHDFLTDDPISKYIIDHY